MCIRDSFSSGLLRLLLLSSLLLERGQVRRFCTSSLLTKVTSQGGVWQLRPRPINPVPTVGQGTTSNWTMLRSEPREKGRAVLYEAWNRQTVADPQPQCPANPALQQL
eukprot:5590340-Alexandrium_andersonii.AAC.1